MDVLREALGCEVRPMGGVKEVVSTATSWPAIN
jgi:hypothetical protein